ncbi:MAG: hypothetical protein WA825_13670 [Steroidobacteraceae bacterium]
MTQIRSSLPTAHLIGITVALWAAASLAHAQAPSSATSSAPRAMPTRAHGAKASRPVAQPLDLKAPPLNRIFSRKEMRYMLAYDPDDSSATEVSVKGSRPAIIVPVTPGNQLLAVPWALLHPTQAWRVFTPIEQP